MSALRRRGLHFTDSEANAWISREQTYFVGKTTDHSENRLWMMPTWEGDLMGFPSPATDYVEQRLSVNSICNVGPNTLVFERSGGYVVLDISPEAKAGSRF